MLSVCLSVCPHLSLCRSNLLSETPICAQAIDDNQGSVCESEQGGSVCVTDLRPI
jgi:hypothetical protein